jgi:hypothetical protein
VSLLSRWGRVVSAPPAIGSKSFRRVSRRRRCCRRSRRRHRVRRCHRRRRGWCRHHRPVRRHRSVRPGCCRCRRSARHHRWVHPGRFRRHRPVRRHPWSERVRRWTWDLSSSRLNCSALYCRRHKQPSKRASLSRRKVRPQSWPPTSSSSPIRLRHIACSSDELPRGVRPQTQDPGGIRAKNPMAQPPVGGWAIDGFDPLSSLPW